MDAYLFDVDGVLSDPKVKQVTEPELFDHLIKRLEAGSPVCLNTGRSLSFMEKEVIDPLINKIGDRSILKNFIAIGEKGGVWMTFSDDAEKTHEIDNTITVPKILQQEVKELVTNSFLESMFYDDSKETMISVEMHDNFDIEKFHAGQKELDKQLQSLLEKHNLSDDYVLEPSIIATDIQNNHVGKALGADRFIKFLQTMQLKPDQYFAFGDSKSDIEMSDELDKRGEKVEFVFVGDKEKMKGVERSYPIEFVSGFTKGTLEYLNN